MKKLPAITPNQLGQIELTEDMVLKKPESARHALQSIGMVPFGIQHDAFARRFYYTGISSFFEPLHESEYIPRYALAIGEDEDGETSIRCHRTPDAAI